MANELNISKFYYNSFIKSIIFSDCEFENLKNGEYDGIIFNFKFIEILESFIKYIEKDDYLEKKEIECLFEIINYIRINKEYKDIEEKRIYYTKFNDSISILNRLKGEGIFDFYCYEISKRLLGEKIKGTSEDYFYYKEMIKKSFSMDFIYLSFVIGELSNDSFNESLSIIANDINYFMFLNSLIFDQPELLNGVLLRERTMKVIRYREKTDAFEVTTEEKKMIKKYKKLYKKLIREA